MQTDGKSGPPNYSYQYVWNKADCIGKGATAQVFLGRHKQTGEKCAVKLFNARENRALAAYPRREIELLGKLKHRNVITLLASETELSTGNDVLVMPYCQDGSLLTVLEQPQYGFGFPEGEFLIFLEHTTAGLEYLQTQRITHRDIKPGNILKFIDDTGTSIYKLTDFGSARELIDEEQFESMYGTEEYLHPDVYQRAILKGSGNQFFDASVDLWSFGCTIYHVATGQLPFQAYGGRNNRVVMHQLTSEKPSGVISGIQAEPGGTITWAKDLPNTCLLSLYLKNRVRPLISGLMERDKSMAWSFEQTFSHVKSITGRKRIKVFFPAACLDLVFYMRGNEKYSNIQEEVTQSTGVMPENQLLLFRDKELSNYVSTSSEICNYPENVLEGDIYLFNRDTLVEMNISLPETVTFPSCSVTGDVNEDTKLAKWSCAVAYFYEFQTEKVLRWQKDVKLSVYYLREYVRGFVNPLTVRLAEAKMLTLESERTIGILESCQNVFKTMLPVLSLTSCKDCENIIVFVNQRDVIDNLRGSIAKEDKRIKDIDTYLHSLLKKIEKIDITVTSSGGQNEQYWISSIQEYRQTINSIRATFEKHKRYGELHPHEVFIHQTEMKKLKESNLQLLSAFQGYLDNLKRVHGEAKEQFGLLLKHLTSAKKVEVDVQCVSQFHKEIDNKLAKIDKTYREATFTKPQLLEVIPAKIDGSTSLVKQAIHTQESLSNVKLAQCGATGSTEEHLTPTSSTAKAKMYCDLAKQFNEARLKTESAMKTLTENKKSLESIVAMIQKGDRH